MDSATVISNLASLLCWNVLYRYLFEFLFSEGEKRDF